MKGTIIAVAVINFLLVLGVAFILFSNIISGAGYVTVFLQLISVVLVSTAFGMVLNTLFSIRMKSIDIYIQKRGGAD